MLANDETPGERRETPRLPSSRPATLRAADLTLEGTVTDVSRGGAFLGTQLLIEVGETGVLTVGEVEIGVQVIWMRGNAHPDGPGMGLVFDDDAANIDRIVELLSP